MCPAHTRGAAAGGVEGCSQGIGTDLRTADAKTHADHAQPQQYVVAMALTNGEQARSAAEQGQHQHVMRVEAVHGRPQAQCAKGATDLEERADQRRLAQAQAGVTHQQRQPVGHAVDDQQAHEKRQPKRQGAAA
ncbi:hypothetical protein D3C71_1526180 [compost metagenome]